VMPFDDCLLFVRRVSLSECLVKTSLISRSIDNSYRDSIDKRMTLTSDFSIQAHLPELRNQYYSSLAP